MLRQLAIRTRHLRDPLPTILSKSCHERLSLPTGHQVRLLSSSCNLLGPKPLPPRPKILDEDITESFLKGSGPGGQKINKTSSAVQLKHLPIGIVIKCQETRSRSQNRKIARRILSDRIEEAQLGEGSRTAIKAREQSRKKASADKKRRRKYRKLEEEGKEGNEDDDDGEDAQDASSGKHEHEDGVGSGSGNAQFTEPEKPEIVEGDQKSENGSK